MPSIDIDKLLHQFTYIPKQPLIFSSALFLFMFAGFISIFYLLHRKHNVKLLYVVLFSYYFYYKSSGIYFLLLILSTVVDYNLANIMYNAREGWQQKSLLIFSLVLNL